MRSASDHVARISRSTIFELSRITVDMNHQGRCAVFARMHLNANKTLSDNDGSDRNQRESAQGDSYVIAIE